MKKIWIIIAAVVLIGAAIGAFIMFSGDEGDDTLNNNNTDNSVQSETFEAIATEDLSFEAKLTGTANDSEYTATILSDGKGNSKYTTVSEGETLESYVLSDGSYITCTGGGCYKFSSSQSQVPTDEYEYSKEDFDAFKESAVYQGKESCPAGTCDVWEVQDGDTNTKTKVYLASDKKVSKLTATTDDSSITITYDYKDVTITAPSDVQSF